MHSAVASANASSQSPWVDYVWRHTLFLEYLLNRLLLGVTIVGSVCIETMWIAMLLTAVTLSSTETLHVFAQFFYAVTLTVYTGVPGLKCCVLGPDNGV